MAWSWQTYLFRILVLAALGLALPAGAQTDLPLTVSPLKGDDQKPFAYAALATIWRFGAGERKFIPVCWETAGFEAEKATVRAAVTAAWESHSGLRFTSWAACTARFKGIRIAIADVGPHTNGLGTQLKGRKNGMVLNFTFSKWGPECAATRDLCIKAIGVHEFGHAIGFAHEQNRADTPGECMARNLATESGSVAKTLTSYDPQSVMNYCNPAYNNLGVLSALDQRAVAMMYCPPADPGCTPEVFR